MAGRYSRTYSRKRPLPASSITQFDALVMEGTSQASNQPAATKTAGHIGKWGMTSFTSIRSINGSYGKEENMKKSGYGKSESPNSSPSHWESATNSEYSADKPTVSYKRRKFFKSRGESEAVQSDAVTQSTKTVVGPSTLPLLSSTNNIHSNVDKSRAFDALLASSSVNSSSSSVLEETNAGKNEAPEISVGSVTKSSSIKLKIFKSRKTENFTQDHYSSKVELPSDDSCSSSSSSSSSSDNTSQHPEYLEKHTPTKVVDSYQLVSSDIKLHTKSYSEPTSSLFTNFSNPSVSPTNSLVDSDSTLRSSLDDHCGEMVRRGVSANMYDRTSRNVESCKYLSSSSNSASASDFAFVHSDSSSTLENESNFIDSRNGSSTRLSEIENTNDRNYTREVRPVPDVSTNVNNSSNSKFSNKCYGGRKKNVPVASVSSRVEQTKSINKVEDVLDIRNSSQSLSRYNSSLMSSNNSDYKSVYSSLDVKPVYNEDINTKKNLDADLFSSGFDDEEIVDRTTINMSDINNKAVDNKVQQSLVNSSTSSLETSTEDKDIISTSLCDKDLTLKSNIALPPKSFSFPARGVLRSVTNSLSASNDGPKQITSTKKRSIFKSRLLREDSCSDTKSRATYNHKWHSSKEDDEETPKTTSSKNSAASSSQSFDDYDFDGCSDGALRRVQSCSAASSLEGEEFSKVTSVKCNKQAKQFYTVIKNVKKTHQLQESGEFQEFNDDVEYFLDALRSTNSPSTRCLAALNLAHKCMVPAFRMHVRAHATVCKFFRALQDAPSHAGLSLCSAMVMFALSQDRLNMDLDRDSLELMLNLLDTDSNSSTGGGTSSSNGVNSTMTEAVTKIRELCRQLKSKGHAKHLDLNSIDAGTLAMETLLSLTSKRAGEWFKEELRQLGGVDHLVRTVSSCVTNLLSLSYSWSQHTSAIFSKVERCLKVLENVTHQNESNQEYLLEFESGVFARTLMDMFRLCHDLVPSAADEHRLASANRRESTDESLLLSPQDGLPPKKKHTIASSFRIDQTMTSLQIVSSALMTTVKVLVNLTHNSGLGLGSKELGRQARTYDLTLSCLLVLPEHLLPETRFEVQVLSCCLLLNLVEHSVDNRAALMRTRAPHRQDDNDLFQTPRRESAIQALVSLFYACEASAREHEAHTDQIIDQDLDQSSRPKGDEGAAKEDELEETVERLLQKAGHHMEDTLIAAYIALLTGYCIMDNKECEEVVRALQPEGHFRAMVVVLRKFLRFMDLTATTSLLRALKPTERVVKYMETLDPPLSPAPETVAERERRQQQEDVDDSDENPSDDIMDAFGF